MTFNTLKVMASTQMRPLAKAIIARMLGKSHTVLECYGQAALVLAVQVLLAGMQGHTACLSHFLCNMMQYDV
jgi:uncharacterized membrane protein